MSTTTDIERRFVGDLEIRAENGKRTLTGLAIPYGKRSEGMDFREVIAPGAFAANLRSDPDVRALVEHDRGRIIGRTKSGTLRLVEGQDGVRVTISPPNNSLGKDIIESVSRGDLAGMSVGFRTIRDSWSTMDGEPLRTVEQGELFDVSLTAFPVYPDTSIALRSLDRWRNEKGTPMPKTKPREHAEESVQSENQDETRSQESTTEDTSTEETRSEARTEKPKPERRTVPAQPAQTHTPAATKVDGPEEWRSVTDGREVRVLRPDQHFADLYRGNEPLSLGRAVRALVVGDWSGAEAEHRALSTVANPTAGILVPNPLLATVIDKARAMAVLTRAGARTVDMTASTLKIARVASDATAEVKAENAAFTGSDVEFDGVELTAYLIGLLVKMSRELAADAPNAVQLIEDTIARKLAERIDYYGLQGSGSAQPLGLLNFSGVNTKAVGGAVDYDDVLDGIKECLVDNHEPNAWVLSPTRKNGLAQLKVNSEANHYATAPADVAALTRLVTTNMPDDTIALGDFRRFLIGLRQGPMLEVTTEGGSAFENHQVYIKLTWRGCFNAEHRDAFCTLTGIT